jgi:type 1 glutamine amidotransferase
MTGAIDGKPAEPAAWTFQRSDGGRSFYTSLGHKEDFQNPDFQRLLFNGMVWASGIETADFIRVEKVKP